MYTNNFVHTFRQCIFGISIQNSEIIILKYGDNKDELKSSFEDVQ